MSLLLKSGNMATLRFSVSHLLRCHQQLTHRLVPRHGCFSAQITEGRNPCVQSRDFHAAHSRAQKVEPLSCSDDRSTIENLKDEGGRSDVFPDSQDKELFEKSIINQLIAEQIGQAPNNDLNISNAPESDLNERRAPVSYPGRARTRHSLLNTDQVNELEDDGEFDKDLYSLSGDLEKWKHNDYTRYDPDADLVRHLTRFMTETHRELTPREMLQIMSGADQLALNIMRLREQSEHDAGEQFAWKRCAKMLFFLNVPESVSNLALLQNRHDRQAVQEFCANHLNVPDVGIRFIRRTKFRKGGGPSGMLVTFESDLTARSLLDAYDALVNEGYKEGIRVYKARPLIERKFSSFLRIEKKVRNKLSELRNEPWQWEIQGERVLPKLNNAIHENVHVLQQVADEYAARIGRFKEISERDQYEYDARSKLEDNLILLNVPSSAPMGQRDSEEDQQIVRRICEEIEVDYSEIQSIQTVHYGSSYSYIAPIRLVIPNFHSRRCMMERRIQLHLHGSEPWMHEMFINLDLTYLQKYLMKNLREEMKIRNMIARHKDEPFYWIIKRMQVIRQFKDGAQPKSLGQFDLD